MGIVIRPNKTYNTNSGRWSIYNAETLGVPVVMHHSDVTGSDLAEIFPNPDIRFGSTIAWANGRQSRSPDTLVEILSDIMQKGVDSDKKIEKFVNSYGHSSIADMAQVSIHFINVPMHFPMSIFNDSKVHSGQEKSTRYQKQFSDAFLHPLDFYLPNPSDELKKEYQALGNLALNHYEKMKKVTTREYEDFFKPENEKEKKSLESRVLDSARSYLLLGLSTGFAFEASTREWSKIITHLKASNIGYYKNMGSQIKEFLSPLIEIENYLGFKSDSPSLVRHTEEDNSPKDSFNKVLKFFGKKFLCDVYGRIKLDLSDFDSDLLKTYMELKGIDRRLFGTKKEFRGFVDQNVKIIDRKYTEGERTFAMYLLTLFPDTDSEKALPFIHNLRDNEKKELSEITFGNFDYRNQMPEQFGETTSLGAIINLTFGEARDLNRHRAWQRFIQSMPLPYVTKLTNSAAVNIINKGYGLPAYFTEISEFSKLKEQMESGLKEYYEKLSVFVEHVEKEFGYDIGYEFIYNLLPLAHKTELIMHGTPKQAEYLSQLRVRSGGHINYRQIAFDMVKGFADLDPSLDAIRLNKRPDPRNRKEFFNRS